MIKKIYSILEFDVPNYLYKYLYAFFAITAIQVIYILFKHALNEECCQIYFADWLINIDGGFIRRGLLGSSILNLSQKFHIKPQIIVSFIQGFLYLTIYTQIALMIKNSKVFKICHIFLFIYPTNLLFPLFDHRGMGRKEIIIIAFFYYLISKKNFFESKASIYILSLVFSLMLFAHEQLIFFYPLLLYGFSTVYEKSMINLKNAFFILVPPVLIWLLIYFFGTKISLLGFNKMTTSINPDNVNLVRSQLDHLKFGFSEQIDQLIEKFSIFSIPNLVATAFLIYLPIKLSKNIDKSLIFFNSKIFLFCLLCQLPLFFAIDWGRWLYVDSSVVSIIYFMSLNAKGRSNSRISKNKVSPKHFFYFLTLAFLFIFSWKIHHCCASALEIRWIKFHII